MKNYISQCCYFNKSSKAEIYVCKASLSYLYNERKLTHNKIADFLNTYDSNINSRAQIRTWCEKLNVKSRSVSERATLIDKESTYKKQTQTRIKNNTLNPWANKSPEEIAEAHKKSAEGFKKQYSLKSNEEKEIENQKRRDAWTGEKRKALGEKQSIRLTNLYLDKDKKNEKLAKERDTKKRNNSFAKSKQEDEYYEYLLKTYDIADIDRQHKDNRYPFNCDFYIYSEDRYIEWQGYYTHGPAPFDENNPEHIALLEQWKQKNTEKMSSAMYDWTIRDVEKKNTIINNKLNATLIYPNRLGRGKHLIIEYRNGVEI